MPPGEDGLKREQHWGATLRLDMEGVAFKISSWMGRVMIGMWQQQKECKLQSSFHHRSSSCRETTAQPSGPCSTQT